MGRLHALLTRLRGCASVPTGSRASLRMLLPDGTVTQITGAGKSGAQRDSMSDPKPLEPGKVYDLDVGNAI